MPSKTALSKTAAAPAATAAPTLAKARVVKAVGEPKPRPGKAEPVHATAISAAAVQPEVLSPAEEEIVTPVSPPKIAPAAAPLAASDGASGPKPAAAPEPQFRSPPKMPGHMPGMHGRPQIAPRAMAAKETFVEGDYVVYPTHGVGKVERIATEEIAGHKLELIHITFEENRMTLRVPVAKARTAGLRKLATRALFDKALALMKGRARIKRTMWSRRAQEYEQKINSGDPMQIAEVVRDLYRNAGQPDQSFSERQIYENAMDRLAAEYAALEQTDKATAMQRLMDDLKTVVKGAPVEVDAEGVEVEPVA